MPPLPNVPGVTKIEISGTYHDTQWLNIFYTGYSGSAPPAGSLSSYQGSWATAVEDAYGAEMSVDNELTGWKITDLATDVGAVVEGSFSTFGSRTGDFQPANVCMVASLEISRRYRGGHPRKYLPWGTSGTMASGSTKDWDSGFVTDCQSKFDTMIANFTGVTFGGTTWNNNVNVSYRSGGVVRTAAQVDVVTSAIVRTRICSQRRRLGKVGG